MPNQCRSEKINVNGDFELEDGDFVEDLTAASEVILALRSTRGSSAIAPWYGTRLRSITKLTKRAPKLAEFYAREGLQFLIDRGALRNLVVTAEIVGAGLEIVVSYTDASGRPQRVPYLHPIGA